MLSHLPYYWLMPCSLPHILSSFTNTKSSLVKTIYLRYDLRIKTMFGSSWPPVACRRAHVLLDYLCLFAYSGAQRILCYVFVLFFFILCAIFVPPSLDCPFWLPLRYSQSRGKGNEYIFRRVANVIMSVVIWNQLYYMFRRMHTNLKFWGGIHLIDKETIK